MVVYSFFILSKADYTLSVLEKEQANGWENIQIIGRKDRALVQNHPNISRRNVLCSFFGADFRPDEALAAGNIRIFSRTITMYGRKSAR